MVNNPQAMEYKKKIVLYVPVFIINPILPQYIKLHLHVRTCDFICTKIHKYYNYSTTHIVFFFISSAPYDTANRGEKQQTFKNVLMLNYNHVLLGFPWRGINTPPAVRIRPENIINSHRCYGGFVSDCCTQRRPFSFPPTALRHAWKCVLLNWRNYSLQ